MADHLVSPSADVENGQLPEGWRPTPLRDVAREFFGGGTPSTNRADFWDGDIPWTTSAHISDDLYVRKGARLITKEGLSQSSSRYIPAGNLLIGTRVGVGKVAINALGIAISQDLTGMIVDQGRADVEFLAYVIRSDDVQRQFRNGMRGTTIKGIPRDDLQRVEIPLPPLPSPNNVASPTSSAPSSAPSRPRMQSSPPRVSSNAR